MTNVEKLSNDLTVHAKCGDAFTLVSETREELASILVGRCSKTYHLTRNITEGERPKAVLQVGM